MCTPEVSKWVTMKSAMWNLQHTQWYLSILVVWQLHYQLISLIVMPTSLSSFELQFLHVGFGCTNEPYLPHHTTAITGWSYGELCDWVWKPFATLNSRQLVNVNMILECIYLYVYCLSGITKAKQCHIHNLTAFSSHYK